MDYSGQRDGGAEQQGVNRVRNPPQCKRVRPRRLGPHEHTPGGEKHPRAGDTRDVQEFYLRIEITHQLRGGFPRPVGAWPLWS
jgi:hypothetical protein